MVDNWPEVAIFVVVSTIFLAAPIGLLVKSTSSADADFQELIDFLEREAQAKADRQG